jgi:flagellar hook protein FlgE
MIDFSVPLAGMQQAESQFNASATQIARAAEPQADSVNLSSAAVNMIQAKNDFAANVKVVRMLDEMTKPVLNMVG